MRMALSSGVVAVAAVDCLLRRMLGGMLLVASTAQLASDAEVNEDDDDDDHDDGDCTYILAG